MKHTMIFAMLLLALAACSKKEEAAAPAAPAPVAVAELKVAIDPTYEPFTFKSADGQPSGFDVDMANAICEQIKRKCVFVEQVWDSMIPGLTAKKYDVIISSMSITDDRLKEVDFSDKYYNTPSRIVLKKSINYTNKKPMPWANSNQQAWSSIPTKRRIRCIWISSPVDSMAQSPIFWKSPAVF